MMHNDTVDFKYGFPVYCRQVVKSIRVNKLFAAKTVQAKCGFSTGSECTFRLIIYNSYTDCIQKNYLFSSMVISSNYQDG